MDSTDLSQVSITEESLFSDHRTASSAQIASWVRDSVSAADANDLYRDHLRFVLSAVNQVMAAFGVSDLLISSGGHDRYFGDDQYKMFRSSPYFAHLCSLSGPYHLLHFSTSYDPMLIVYQNQDYWHKVPDYSAHPHYQCLSQSYEICQVDQLDLRFGAYGQRLGSKRRVFVGDHHDVMMNVDYMQINPSEIVGALSMIRTRKTSWEVSCLVEATRIAVSGHRAVADRFSSSDLISERDLYYIYESAIHQIPEQFPYSPIIAMNEHTSYLHYDHRSTTRLSQRRTLLVDAGAKHGHYGSDITRTYLMNMPHHTRGYDVYKNLLTQLDSVQQSLCAQVVAGGCFLKLTQSCQQMIVAALKDCGCLVGAPDVDRSTALARIFFPHGLGHMLGVCVHDANPFKASAPWRSDTDVSQILQKGHVFTIEPGIYFIKSQLDLALDELKSYVDQALFSELMAFGGMRIEDNIVISSEGSPANLTRLCEDES